MIHPKIVSAGAAAVAYAVLTAILAALETLPDNEWAQLAYTVVGVLLPVLAGYATPGGTKGVAVDQGAKKASWTS